jgi:hypothetical protein
MTRPRKPDEPDRYPPCSRCQRAYQPAVCWPDGGICIYCYQQAKRTRGSCSNCGHEGVLPGRAADGGLTCRSCSGIQLNVDCVRCGAEQELYSGGLCWPCTLSDRVDEALAGPTGTIREELVPMAAALKNMARPNSGVTWIQQKPVMAVFRQLATGELPLDHDTFDALPRSKTVAYIRELFVEHGVLPGRDRHVAAYERWLTEKLAAIDDLDQRTVIERFGRWHHLRRLRKAATANPVTLSALMNAKQSTTVAVNFLAWLARNNVGLEAVSQHDIDRWHASGPTTNGRVDTFLYWAASNRLISKIEVPGHQRGSGPTLAEDQRISAIRRILTDDDLLLSARVAAGLVLIFGQPVYRVAAMQTHQVTIDSGRVAIRFGRDDLDVPEPFATLLASLCGSRANLQTAAHRQSRWLFPGYTPGQHINPIHLANQLREHGAPPLATRAGAWRQLSLQIPSSILAEALGISPVTAMKHAQLAGADYLRYAREGGDGD